MRVVCSYIKDVYLIRDRLMAQDDIHIMEIKDYIEQPKGNGYRSLHIIIRVPVYFMNKTDGTRRAADPHPCDGSLGEPGARHQVQVTLPGRHDGFSDELKNAAA